MFSYEIIDNSVYIRGIEHVDRSIVKEIDFFHYLKMRSMDFRSKNTPGQMDGGAEFRNRILGSGEN